VRSILQLQRTIGNQAVQRMLQTDAEEREAGFIGTVSALFGRDACPNPIHPPGARAIQASMAISQPEDIYEQEADRTAEQVMRTPEPKLRRACACGGGCRKCQAEQLGQVHERLQTKRFEASDTGQIAAPPIVHEVLRSPGQPLDLATRAFMEPRFGRDFSRVRVHSGAVAENSARDVNAHAYTVEHNIVFGAGQFTPRTHEGRRLIAHELTHVVQQSGMDRGHGDQSDKARGQSNVPLSPSVQRSFLQSGMALQRAPVRAPGIKPIPALAPLEVVAREVADLILKNYAAAGISAGPVLTAVRDMVTGKIYIGLNSGIPPAISDVVAQGIAGQLGRVNRGEVIVVRTDPLAKGGHSEANAVNEAVSARQTLLKHKVTEAELRTFELHNVWLKGADRKFTAAPRCEHCARITRSTSVTSSVFFAEGGVAGEIKALPHGGMRIPRVGPGGATGSIKGEITGPGLPAVTPSSVGQNRPVSPAVGEIVQGVTTSGFRTAGRFLAREAPGLALQAVLMALFPPGVNIHNAKAEELSRTKLDPAVQDAVAKQASMIDKLVDDDLAKSIYANVKARLDYRVDGNAFGDAELYLKDVTFLDMKITYEDIVLSDPQFTSTSPGNATKEITYSLLLYKPWARALQEYQECVQRYGTGRIPPAAGAEAAQGSPEEGPCIPPRMKPMEGP
jgi:hypothetical protein